MLRSLHIGNVAVIRQADIDFTEGLCVLTGETGAGKSLLIDSLNALTGGRVSRDLIRAGEENAMISALFDGLDEPTRAALSELGVELPEDEDGILLQRTLSRDGKSVARIGGRAVTQSLLREVGALLVNIHGQSDNQKLMQKAAHLSLLDAYAGDGAALAEYRSVYAAWRQVSGQLADLRQDEGQRLRTREMLEYQIADIDAAHLKPGEEDKLTARRDRLQHQEKIDRQLRLAARALRDGEKATAAGLLDRAATALASLTGILPEAEELAARAESLRLEAEDIADRTRALTDGDAVDATAELDRLEGRLDTIQRLGRKYGAGVDAILAFRADAAERLAGLDTADDRIAACEEQEKRLREQLDGLSAVLTRMRTAAAQELAGQVAESLAFLDMPRVRFEVSLRRLDKPGADGADDAEFCIATNPGEPVQPMIRIASGGELSRIMLALRSVLNEKYGVGVSIYDEIDTGISGRTARKVGIKLRRIARCGQVICVTHSAQIASLADAQFRIEKHEVDGRAETSVRCLEPEERVDEIARILGGLDLTDSQRAAARELIAEGERL